MSSHWTIVLDRQSVTVLPAGRAASQAMTRTFRSDVSDETVATELSSALESVRAEIGDTKSFTLIVGLGWLEVAQPTLPPVNAETARAILWRDLDRHFAIGGDAALVVDGAFAMAMPARVLHSCVVALQRIASVTAIVTSPQVTSAIAAGTQSLTIPAGTGEIGIAQIAGGALLSLRRVPLALAPTIASSGRTLSSADIAAAGAAWKRAPHCAQLFDVALLRDAQRAQARSRWLSIASLAAAALVLAFSAQRAREAQLSGVTDEVSNLTARAAAATAASDRIARARTETAAIDEARTRQRAGDAPLRVLAALTSVLPRDVVVQRVEWDGEQWRVEGTTDRAPKLVPLLDGDARFTAVRALAPSQRFLDVSRQRETFTIGFHMRDNGGARGLP